MSELYNIGELPDITFPLSFNIIYRYQSKYHFLTEIINYSEYQKGSIRGIWNTINF